MTAAELAADLDRRYGPMVRWDALKSLTGRGRTYLLDQLDRVLQLAGQSRAHIKANWFTFAVGPWAVTVTYMDGYVWRVKERGGSRAG